MNLTRSDLTTADCMKSQFALIGLGTVKKNLVNIMCLGIPGQIVEIINAELQLAQVDLGGVKRPVNIACVVDDEHPVESCVGDWVLVHVGFAMNRLDTEEAEETLRLFEELAKFEELEQADIL